MNLTRTIFSLVFITAPLAVLGQSNAEPIAKTFTVECEDERYKKIPVEALFRFYSVENADTIYGPQHYSEQGSFKEFLYDKDGIEIRIDTLTWRVPLPRVPGDDSLHVKFLMRSDSLAARHKINVAIVMPDKRSCYYSIPGEGFRNHYLTIKLPIHTDSLRMQQWRDSTLALDARLNPLIHVLAVSLFAGNGKKYVASEDYAIRCYKRLGTDTLFSNWTYPDENGQMNLHCNNGWNFEILHNGQNYHSVLYSKIEDYCRAEFYVDTTSPERSFATMRYTAKGYEYYGHSRQPGQQTQCLFMCKDSETNKYEEITVGRRFLLPNLSRPAYYVQGIFSLAPFNRFVGLQLKKTEGEAGIFIVDDLTSLRYHYGTEAGRELFSLDKSYTINFFMGPLRGGLGTTLTGGRDRFGWSFRPLFGLSNGGVDLYISYDLYIIGGKRMDDLSRFSFTIAVGPFVKRKHRSGKP